MMQYYHKNKQKGCQLINDTSVYTCQFFFINPDQSSNSIPKSSIWYPRVLKAKGKHPFIIRKTNLGYMAPMCSCYADKDGT